MRGSGDFVVRYRTMLGVGEMITTQELTLVLTKYEKKIRRLVDDTRTILIQTAPFRVTTLLLNATGQFLGFVSLKEFYLHRVIRL